MTITALMDPSQLPDQSQDQNTFDGNFANYFANLVLRGKQENDLAANLNSVAAGGAFAIPYTFTSTSFIGGVAGGNLGLDNGANTSASTTLYLDVTSAAGSAVASLMSQFSASTSPVPGSFRIQKVNDPSKWLTFNFTGATSAPTAYYKTFAVANTGYSAPSPFAAGDSVMLFFQRTGDMGATGATGSISLSVFHAREEQSQGTGGAAGVNISTGVERRVLNTVKNNDISGASLASNQVSLPAGKYRMRARASLDLSGSTNFVGHHKAAIYNVTDGAYAIIGHSNDMAGPGSTIAWGAASQAEGVVTIAGTKVFEVRSIHSDSIYAWGSPVGVSQVEVYTEIIIEKIG